MRIPALSAFTLIVACGLAAAGPKGKSPADSAAIHAGKGHSHACCMGDSGEMAALRKSVQEALKSGDAAKMKGALEKVDAHMAKMMDKMDKHAKAEAMGGDEGMQCGREHGESEAAGAGDHSKHKHE